MNLTNVIHYRQLHNYELFCKYDRKLSNGADSKSNGKA